jgi:hypothetical protein
MNLKNILVLLGIVVLFISYLKINEIINFSDSNLNEVNVKYQNNKNISTPLPMEHIVKIDDEILIGAGLDYPKIFISKEYLTNPIKSGSLFSFNTKTNELKELEIENFPKGVKFHPHGLTLYKDNTEKFYLFIINHSIKTNPEDNEERIEKVLLEINKPKISLTFKNTYSLPMNYFGTLNSIAVINFNTIYFTTHSYFPLPSFSIDDNIDNYLNRIKYQIFDKINILFQKLNIKKTYLYSFDLEKRKINLINNSEGLFNHGLAYNPDKSLLYMARPFERDIKIFEISRNYPSKALLINTIKTIYNAKNIFYDIDNQKIYAGIYGSNKELISLEKSYIQFGNFDNITSFGGFEEIDVSNDYEITELTLMKDMIKGVSSGIKVNNNIYLTSTYQNEIFIYQK